jgi:hypothetical protein
LSRDLWFKDTPVPAATRRILKEAIRPAFGDAGIQIEKGMRTWTGQLTLNQLYVMTLVEALGPAAMALAGETDTMAKAVFRGLEVTAADVAIAIRDGGLPIVSSLPGLNDANDNCEVTTGKEFCGANGKQLTTFERGISAGAFLLGTGPIWRKVAAKLTSF